MLSFEDCVAFCDLTEEEIAAIAEHEGIPDLPAAELGAALLSRPDGPARGECDGHDLLSPARIRAMILDEIEAARRHRDAPRSARLKLVLRHFSECHPG